MSITSIKPYGEPLRSAIRLDWLLDKGWLKKYHRKFIPYYGLSFLSSFSFFLVQIASPLSCNARITSSFTYNLFLKITSKSVKANY